MQTLPSNLKDHPPTRLELHSHDKSDRGDWRQKFLQMTRSHEVRLECLSRIGVKLIEAWSRDPEEMVDTTVIPRKIGAAWPSLPRQRRRRLQMQSV